MERKSGVLLHMTSLSSEYGIGDMGTGAYLFVDFLKKAKQTYWQVLPLNPTDCINGNSPYSSPSAFAGNILLISPEMLVRDGYLTKSDVKSSKISDEKVVDFKNVSKKKLALFEKAFQKNKDSFMKREGYSAFECENAYWLEDFAMYSVIKDKNQHRIWIEWEEGLRLRDSNSLKSFAEKHSEEILKIKFLQFLFDNQWKSLKKYANHIGISIIGDIPIYVNFDSADVWTHSKLFKLDESMRQTVVAGVPPDYFSETGQRWGNPVYDWEKCKEEDFAWWLDRMKRNHDQCDVLRIDHFRGLINYWEIPVHEETAINGYWQPVPTDDFFGALKNRFPGLPIIAEDLGLITDDVKAAIKALGFPGMKILMFAFGGALSENPYIPGNFENNSVIYTGTHDNNTVKGWYENDISPEEKANMFEYMNNQVDTDNLHWELISMSMNSSADLAITPLQDILGLGGDARMNTPATIENNWVWRYLPDQLSADLAKKMAKLTKETRRL